MSLLVPDRELPNTTIWAPQRHTQRHNTKHETTEPPISIAFLFFTALHSHIAQCNERMISFPSKHKETNRRTRIQYYRKIYLNIVYLSRAGKNNPSKGRRETGDATSSPCTRNEQISLTLQSASATTPDFYFSQRRRESSVSNID